MTGQINVNKIAARTGTTITIDTGDALDVTLVKGEGTNTTNLKQGLLKSWSFFDVTTDDIHDSFNIASLTDNGSGATTTAYTNNMASINYAPLGGATHDGGLYGCYMPLDHDTPPTTSQVDFDHMKPWSSSGERVDQELCVLHISGDLA